MHGTISDTKNETKVTDINRLACWHEGCTKNER